MVNNTVCEQCKGSQEWFHSGICPDSRSSCEGHDCTPCLIARVQANREESEKSDFYKVGDLVRLRGTDSENFVGTVVKASRDGEMFVKFPFTPPHVSGNLVLIDSVEHVAPSLTKVLRHGNLVVYASGAMSILHSDYANENEFAGRNEVIRVYGAPNLGDPIWVRDDNRT